MPSGGALDLLAGLVLEDGRRWGEAALPFQWDDARAILSSAPPRQHFLTRPRGASKTTDAAAAAAAALLAQLPPGSTSYAVAADVDQARLLLNAIRGFARRTPGLGNALRVQASRVTAASRGASLEVLPADGPSAYGILPHLVIVDELAQWSSTPGPREVWTAVITAMPKVPGARLVVLTTAGDPAHWAAGVRDHALAHPDRWRVNEVPGPLAWIEPSALQEQRALLPESLFARLHLNVWTTPEDRLTTRDALAACVALDGPQDPRPASRYVIGLDLGLVSDRTVAAVAHRENDTVVLDRLHVWQGSRAAPVTLQAVEDAVHGLSSEFNRAPVVFDPHQAIQLTQSLARRGVKTHQENFTVRSNGERALLLHTLIKSRRLALPDDAALLDELANVRLRETSPNVYRLDHDTGRHDDRATALALAAQRLYARPAARRPIHEYAGVSVGYL